jgi:hypothetical protein
MQISEECSQAIFLYAWIWLVFHLHFSANIKNVTFFCPMSVFRCIILCLDLLR